MKKISLLILTLSTKVWATPVAASDLPNLVAGARYAIEHTQFSNCDVPTGEVDGTTSADIDHTQALPLITFTMPGVTGNGTQRVVRLQTTKDEKQIQTLEQEDFATEMVNTGTIENPILVNQLVSTGKVVCWALSHP
jgi:hypothetical protein